MKGKLILPYIMSNLLSGVGSAVMFYLSGFDPIWIGTFFATFTMPFFLMVLAGALGISRTSKNLPVIQIINLTAVAWVIYQISARGGFATFWRCTVPSPCNGTFTSSRTMAASRAQPS